MTANKKIILKTTAVIFDMDGVITNTMPYHFAAWKTVLNEAGIRVNKLDIYRREGKTGVLAVKELLQELTGKEDAQLAASILRRKEKVLKEIVRVKFIPGARTLIHELHKQGFRLGLVTGTSRHEVMKILPEPLLEKFQVVITADEIRHGKPNPEPFLKALKKLALGPENAAVIENAPFGIQAARSAGLRCLAVETSLPARYLKEANHIYESLCSLKTNVRFLLNHGHTPRRASKP